MKTDIWLCFVAGEFSVDLYTLPDNLGKMIWDYLVSTAFPTPCEISFANPILTSPYQVKQQLVDV